MTTALEVRLEYTPNPDTLKYAVSVPVLERGSAWFRSREEAAASPLAQRLLDVDGVEAVLLGPDFVTVTVPDPSQMAPANQGVQQALRQFFESGDEVVTAAFEAQDHGDASDRIARQIVEILDQQIRPHVVRDGGDILFDRFEDGVVYLKMKGSCSGCPSSLATLKQGIEWRLQQEIPEVVAVEAL